MRRNIKSLRDFIIIMYKRSWKIPPAVVRGEPCVQGVDDGEDRRLYSLLPNAHCALHRQVKMLK